MKIVNESNIQHQSSVHLDPTVISKISSYLPDSKVYNFAVKSKNKTVSRLLFTQSLKRSSYLFYMEDKPRILSLPSRKEIQNDKIPKINFENFNSKELKNYGFFYNNNEKEIHAFQFNPFIYQTIKVDESIEELYFYSITPNYFFVNVNNASVYKIVSLNIKEKVPLVEGFFFEPLLMNNFLYTDFFGDKLVVQSLDNVKDKYESYSLKFTSQTHYDFIGKDMIIIDFSGEEVLAGVLPKSDKPKEELRNVLFKMNLVKGSTENTITLEFIDYLPEELKAERFDEVQYHYFSRNMEEKNISLWQNNKNLGKICLDHGDKVVNIAKIDDNRLMVEYTTVIIVIDFIKCRIINIIDMKKRIPEIRFHCNLEQKGDYFHETLLIEQEELGAWRNFILDQNFEKVLEIEGDDYVVFSE